MNGLLISVKGIVLLSLLLSQSGCLLGVRLDRGVELINHPQFNQAATHAPQFVEEALNIIAELEHRLESQ